MDNKTLEGQFPKTTVNDISFIDWDGLSENEYQQLNRIINQSYGCAAVKLPFSSDKKKNAVQRKCDVSNEEKQQVLSAEQKLGDSHPQPVFQTGIPPPSSHQPVIAYPIPVPHWTQGPPPPPGRPPPPTHFPITVQGGYVFPSAPPPPPLVTTGDPATIAFVAAMSGGQPVYAIPGMPMQGHYPATAAYPQAEPIDLSAPPVTIHHFVQPDGSVLPHVPPIPMPQTPVLPVQTVNSNGSQNSVSVPLQNHLPPGHLQQQFISNHSRPDSHVVCMPQELETTSPQLQDPNPKTISTEQEKPANQPPIRDEPQSETTGVEFVGPAVFTSDGADQAHQHSKPVQNGISNSGKVDIPLCDAADGASKKTTSHNNLSPSSISDSIEENSAHSKDSNISGASVSNQNSPVASNESLRNDGKDSSGLSPSPSLPGPAPAKMWSSLFGKPKVSGSAATICPTAESYPAVTAVPAAVLVEEVKSVRYWQQKEAADAKAGNSLPPQKVIQAVGAHIDPLAPRILDMLSDLPVVHTPIVIQPRGLVNGSNVCFMNATLQVLMGCPPFIHLFRAFKTLGPRKSGGSCTPIFDSLIEFVNSFQNGQRAKNQGSRNKKGAYLDINVGQPFSPTSLLNIAQDILGLRIGIQHDAEEFLSKILMICHEELENVMKLNQSNLVNNNVEKTATSNGFAGTNSSGSNYAENDQDGEEDDDDSWQQVGPKNYHVETNVNDCGRTPLSSIFSGLSRSCLTRETGKNSDTLDSFFTLKLDIQGENIHSVSDALQKLNVIETLHDIDGGKIQGQRRMFFDVLPPVLIMHLKLFQYSGGSGKKIQKQIDFDVDLTIPRETLSRVGKTKYASSKSRSYKLFGVVNHHGLKMTDGHYTSDVFLPVASGWLRFDDSEVFAIHEKQVLQHSDRHMPYLLFYRRLDIS